MTITPTPAGLVMITNGGAHPPEKWAEATARTIVVIDPDMSTERRRAAQVLQAKVALVLTPHHAKLQAYERTQLKAKGHAHLSASRSHADAVADQAFQHIAEAAAQTPWGNHFRNPEVESVMRRTIASHLRTSAREEREWHCHRNQDSPESQAWLAKSRSGHPDTYAQE